MSSYQLSYDVKDSVKTDNNEFRKRIVKSILSELKPAWIHRPVASTIFFSCTDDMSIVKPKIKQLMEGEAFYILTEAKIDMANNVVMAWSINAELEKNFELEWKHLKETK